MKKGEVITIDGLSAPEAYPPPPVVGDRMTIEGCDTAFRVAEVFEHEGVYSFRLEPID